MLVPLARYNASSFRLVSVLLTWSMRCAYSVSLMENKILTTSNVSLYPLGGSANKCFPHQLASCLVIIIDVECEAGCFHQRQIDLGNAFRNLLYMVSAGFSFLRAKMASNTATVRMGRNANSGHSGTTVYPYSCPASRVVATLLKLSSAVMM